MAVTIYTKDGKMLCGLSKAQWDTWSPELQNEILCHEAGHVAGGHDIRMGDRDPRKWNVVCDAAIHYSGGVKPEAVEELGGVTYEKLGIPPVPPEIGYDMLPDEPSENGGESCGREDHNHGEELSGAARTRATIASIRGAAELGKLGSQGNGQPRSIPESMPHYPDWMVDLLQRLKKAVAYDDSVRRWTRETRRDVDPIMMPGRAPKMGVACTFIWDLSGSIGEESVKKFLGAVDATPELAGSEIVAFSDDVVGPYPVSQAQRCIEDCNSGGTQFHKGASKRRPGIPCVWITDGYTGDGWPDPHDSDEFWVINTDVEPPHGIRIQSKD